MKKSQQMFNYHVWATASLLEFINNCPELYAKNLESVFPSIRATFEHIYEIDRMWFVRITGKEELEHAGLKTPYDAKITLAKLHETMIDYFKKEDSSKRVTYYNSTGSSFENKLSDLLIHLANHGTYHRGNITAMLHSLGHKSISTDYIYFLRK
ncbi:MULTISPECIES: DinB family protein [unclassified Bacillus (in: firmicutes)]|uniref:DinB family protein n=1 Tax=unclassified Bacillus (in: firmicutes) TaxID=185979 RepID=UPI0008E6C9ED|nr:MULTISPECIES: DinB family protein [unclassified Bacillus (in: firmicutes)]SFB13483.1 Uncharacterized damage-inducible protein DinB (forms a four-helix bundle) [Bacillus sp. UNCCL13]SFQ90003.1 Uncharacterized damage-inducible protein DinB (forms a four-helix bundle) [Bacillus sp. cl95]